MKTFKFFQVHFNPETPVKLEILPRTNRVSEIVLTSEDIALWPTAAQEVLASWNLPKTFTDEGLELSRKWSWACQGSDNVEVVPQMILGFYYGGGDEYPQWTKVYPVKASHLDLNPDRIRTWFEDLGRRSAAAKEEIDAWRAKLTRNFNAALIDLQEGFFFPEEGRTTLLIEDVLGKKLEELEYAYSSGPVITNGPYGACWWLSWERVEALRTAAKVAVEAREKAHDAARAAIKEARRAFQVRALHNLDASDADVLRAERGMYPPDELALRIVQRYAPSAEVLNCDGYVERHMSLTAERFVRLLELETAYAEHGSVPARCAGIELTFKVVEATWNRNCYEEEPAEPALLVTVKDLLGSDWMRTVRVSLFPHSSTQG